MTGDPNRALATKEQASQLATTTGAGVVASILAEYDEETRAMLEAAIASGQSDITPTTPFASIRQKGGPGGERLGGMKFNDGRADIEVPHDIIVLAVKDCRVCWTKDDLSSPPRCKSVDGITRLAEVPDPGIDINGKPVMECAKCIRALWPRERMALADRHPNNDWLYWDDEKPECPLMKNLMCCEPDATDAWILTVSGSSVKPTNSYLGRFKNQRKMTFQVISRIGTEFVKDAEGRTFYVLTWSEQGDTPVEFVKQLVSQYPQMMQALVRDAASVDKVMQMEAEAGASGDEGDEGKGGDFVDADGNPLNVFDN